jgi:hypothetical protein
MDAPFHSARYSIAHAKRRIAEFESEEIAFIKSNPYTRAMEQNTDGTEDFYKIKLTKPMPVGLPGIGFDVVSNLRTALDQAGYDVAVAAGTTGKKAHFPFGLDLTEVQSRANEASKHIPKDIFNYMVSCEPYKTGNYLLWALNQLCNSHKHEILTPVAMSIAGASTGRNFFEGPVISVKIPPVWDREKNEMILAHVKHGTAVQINLQLNVFIALAKVDVVDGAPALRVFNDLASIVERIIFGIEAEARRIKLIR